jgi:putative transposase
MPYEYRNLTPQEREEIVRYRHEHGYPLHAPPHPYREAGYYLITAANFEHAPIMNSASRRTEFETLLLETMKGIQASLIAWVILPNHYHILADFESLDSASAALKSLHGKTSRQWNLEDNLTEKRRVWYKFSDRLMRSEKQLDQTFNYIHYNPIKHGYTDDFLEWAWSSFKLYEEGHGRDWLREKWKANPPPVKFGQGWDDQDEQAQA